MSSFILTSYAIFTREVNGTGSIKMVVGKVEVEPVLKNLIMAQGVVSEGAGLYKSIETNDGRPTYYYRGAVDNNYVSFAGQTWRVVRINEDGTVRMIMDNVIVVDMVYFNINDEEYKYMYYTEATTDFTVMKTLEDWYNNNLSSYDSKIVTSTYCEQAKVKDDDAVTSGNATMEVCSSYTPDFRCKPDGNEKGIVTSKIGLISTDEVLHAGGIFDTANDYYLVNGKHFWTMSPAGFYNKARVWSVSNEGVIPISVFVDTLYLRPVISLEADTLVSGSGLVDDMWIVQP